MIKFVIVEDDPNSLRTIKGVIDKEKYKINDEIKTFEFTGYNKQLQSIITNTDDQKIYILDIELEHSKSGIEIASIIREKDWNSEIIFITNHDKMFECVHRSVYDVFDFIEKYHDLEKRLKKDIKLILSREPDKSMFTYNGRNINLQLYLRSINYIYRDKEDRKVVIVTDNSSYSVGLGVKEILGMLDNRFKMVHRSCIVNTDKVSTFDWNNSKIILNNGKEVNYLSKKYKKGIE